MRQIICAEFHCHTEYSSDSLVKVSDLLAACERKKIDKLAITDHNTIEGALQAKALNPDHVIIAEEIKTTQGEILGYFLEEWIKPGLSPMQTIEALKKQGAFISVAHPFDVQRSATWNDGSLEEILPFVDALEVFNSRCFRSVYNRYAAEAAAKNNLGMMVGSDAHSILELGRATMTLPMFDSADDLRDSIKVSRIETKLSGTWVHLMSRYAKFIHTIRGK